MRSFKYIKVGKEHFSIVPLLLVKNRQHIPVNALIDNGANYSVFKSKIGKDLGIDIRSGKERSLTIGDGNRISIYFHDVDVAIAGRIIRNARIGFSDELGTQFNLLGRKTIFDKFEICLNERDKVVKFNPVYE